MLRPELRAPGDGCKHGHSQALRPRNRPAPRCIAKVAGVGLIDRAVFQQSMCSPPSGSPRPAPPGAGTWELLPEPHDSWDLVLKSDESMGIGCAGSGLWCSSRNESKGVGRAQRRRGERGDCLAFSSGTGGANAHVPTRKWCRRGAEPRPGPGREHGDCQKVADRTPLKLEKQADFPLRWSAVLENWRVERAGPLQTSSSEHLRTGKTRFRTGATKKLTRRHRPKANTNAHAHVRNAGRRGREQLE